MGYLDNSGLSYLWGKIKTALGRKQDKLTGKAGQFVGFDAEGNAQAQDVSASGIPTSEKGQPNGVATLDQAGKVPETQIPERLSEQNLLSDETAAMYGSQKVHKISVNMADVKIGDVVTLPWSGRPTDFIVRSLNYESSLNGDGHILLEQAESSIVQPWNNTNVNTYATCTLDAYLNGGYKAAFPQEVQDAILPTTFWYTPGGGDNALSQLTRDVFLLSATEYGKTASSINVEGDFGISNNDAKRNIYKRTRSPHIGDSLTFASATISPSSGVALTQASFSADASVLYLSFPCICLPSSFSASWYTDGVIVRDMPDIPLPDDIFKSLSMVPRLRKVNSYAFTGGHPALIDLSEFDSRKLYLFAITSANDGSNGAVTFRVSNSKPDKRYNIFISLADGTIKSGNSYDVPFGGYNNLVYMELTVNLNGGVGWNSVKFSSMLGGYATTACAISYFQFVDNQPRIVELHCPDKLRKVCLYEVEL